MSSRRDELLAKKARLAELKRQRELRQEQIGSSRKSIGGESSSPSKTAEERRSEIDNLVSSLIDRQRDSNTSPSGRESRPSSTYGARSDSPAVGTDSVARPQMQSVSTQTQDNSITTSTSETATSIPIAPKGEYITYSKGVQTEPHDIGFTLQQDSEDEREAATRTKRISSRKDLQIHEEIRASLKQEIEEEIKTAQKGADGISSLNDGRQRFPLRTLNDNELNAVTTSPDFISFVERSSKVIERALDEEYDLLADYTRASTLSDDDDYGTGRSSRKSHSLKETLQLYSDKHTRRRMVADLQFSPHFNELLLTSYTKNASAPTELPGLVMLWNIHAPSRPEYTFTAQSDVLAARFSPFHPNLVIGGCYSGQICLWDTRAGQTGVPVRKTPQSGSHLGHTHPVYNISIIGTQNAHNILTASMDGVVCSWSIDMLSQAQEYIILNTPPPAKTEDLAPTSMSFPTSDPTFFLVGTEEGSIYPCHRYDRAGAKAGVDNRLAYRGHTAPVMSTHFHPARGPTDLSDLLLSSSTDWSIKLWRVKPAASSSAAAAVQAATASNTMNGISGSGPQSINPVLDMGREDLVYDAKWAPHKPSVFACVTGAGELEVFDLLYDVEVPIAKGIPNRGKNGAMPFKGLNKLAWEERRGAQIAVGGLDGVVTIFDVGKGLQCGIREASDDEWMNVQKLVRRLETSSAKT